MSAESTAWVTAASGSGFGAVTDTDEYLHGDGPAGDSLTETWYWGFSVPEARINCYAYCWVHPNLGVVTAGLFIYQGIKRQHLAAELFDMPTFLSADVVGDGREIAVPNGLRVTVIEPLEHIRMQFADASRQTELDVELRAVAAPIVRANGKHFEQVMRTRGELVLRGERYDVDGFHVRDRSWGELRPESPAPSPPYTWVTGVFDDGALAFNVGSLDDPRRGPHWLDDYEIPASAAFKDGWITVEGRARRIVEASTLVQRLRGSLRPARIELELRDAEDQRYEITGEVMAGLPWGGWHNITCHLGLVRWGLDGRVGWGDSMDVQWNDYVWRYGQSDEQENDKGGEAL
jgi:hypothetical protein